MFHTIATAVATGLVPMMSEGGVSTGIGVSEVTSSVASIFTLASSAFNFVLENPILLLLFCIPFLPKLFGVIKSAKNAATSGGK